MTYKEYKPESPKVLLNLKDFSYCNYAMCNINTDIEFIEVANEDAVYFNNKYLEATQNIPNDDIESIESARQHLLEEFSIKGYSGNNLVEPIIHN